jgi:hypothetical protein
VNRKQQIETDIGRICLDEIGSLPGLNQTAFAIRHNQTINNIALWSTNWLTRTETSAWAFLPELAAEVVESGLLTVDTGPWYQRRTPTINQQIDTLYEILAAVTFTVFPDEYPFLPDYNFVNSEFNDIDSFNDLERAEIVHRLHDALTVGELNVHLENADCFNSPPVDEVLRFLEIYATLSYAEASDVQAVLLHARQIFASAHIPEQLLAEVIQGNRYEIFLAEPDMTSAHLILTLIERSISTLASTVR